MRRWIVALGVGVALAFTAPIGAGPAEAKKRMKSNQCKYTNLVGQSSTWKCKLDEKCCYDGFLAKGTCLAKSAVCL